MYVFPSHTDYHNKFAKIVSSVTVKFNATGFNTPEAQILLEHLAFIFRFLRDNRMQNGILGLIKHGARSTPSPQPSTDDDKKWKPEKDADDLAKKMAGTSLSEYPPEKSGFNA